MMGSQTASVVVADLLRRLSTNHGVREAREVRLGKSDHRANPGFPNGGLKDAVEVAKDKESLFDVLQNLTSLSLPNSLVGDNGLRLLMEAFKEGSNRGAMLRQLDLTNNRITHEGLKALTDSLSAGLLPGLEHLILAKNWIGVDGTNMLAKVLRTGRHSSLLGLDLSECGLGDDGIVCLSDAMQSGNFKATGIQSLELSGNRFGERGALALTKAMFLGRLPRLAFLNLSQNQLEEKGTLALATVLEAGQIPFLSYLILSHCYLSQAGIPIFQAMERGHVPNLKAVDVSGNYLGDRGSAELAAALGSGRISLLQDLNLSHCGIGGRQVNLLRMAIEGGKVVGLRFLDLSQNEIDVSDENLKKRRSNCSPSSILVERGSLAIESLIRRRYLTSLRYLNLSHCSIADEEFIAVAERMAAGDVPRLEQFHFKGNKIRSKRSIMALVRALESPYLTCLQELELGHNTVGDDVEMALASALTVSPAKGGLAQRLRGMLAKSQKSVADDHGNVREHLARFWRNKSFQGTEPVRTSEAPLQPADKIFNHYLERQYPNDMDRAVDEHTRSPARTPRRPPMHSSSSKFVSDFRPRPRPPSPSQVGIESNSSRVPEKRERRRTLTRIEESMAPDGRWSFYTEERGSRTRNWPWSKIDFRRSTQPE